MSGDMKRVDLLQSELIERDSIESYSNQRDSTLLLDSPLPPFSTWDRDLLAQHAMTQHLSIIQLQEDVLLWKEWIHTEFDRYDRLQSLYTSKDLQYKRVYDLHQSDLIHQQVLSEKMVKLEMERDQALAHYAEECEAFKSNYLAYQRLQSVLEETRRELEQVQLDRVQLEQVQLDQVQLEQVQLDRVQLEQVQLDQVQLDRMQLEQVQLDRVQLDRVQLGQVQLDQIQLDQVQLDQEPIQTPIKTLQSQLIQANIQLETSRLQEHSLRLELERLAPLSVAAETWKIKQKQYDQDLLLLNMKNDQLAQILKSLAQGKQLQSTEIDKQEKDSIYHISLLNNLIQILVYWCLYNTGCSSNSGSNGSNGSDGSDESNYPNSNYFNYSYSNYSNYPIPPPPPTHLLPPIQLVTALSHRNQTLTSHIHLLSNRLLKQQSQTSSWKEMSHLLANRLIDIESAAYQRSQLDQKMKYRILMDWCKARDQYRLDRVKELEMRSKWIATMAFYQVTLDQSKLRAMRFERELMDLKQRFQSTINQFNALLSAKDEMMEFMDKESQVQREEVVRKMSEEWELELVRLKSDHLMQVGELNHKFNELREEHLIQVNELREEHLMQVNELKEEHSLKVNELKEEHSLKVNQIQDNAQQLALEMAKIKGELIVQIVECQAWKQSRDLIQKEVLGEKKIRSELSGIRTELEETRAELEGTRTKLEETRTELGETRTELGETRTELEETRAELEETRTQLEETRTQLEETRSELIETRTQSNAIRTELDSTQTQRCTIQTELEVTRAELEETRTGLEETRTELEVIRTELEETGTGLEETRTGLEETRTELGVTRTELGVTRTELGVTRTELGVTRTELEVTRSELEVTRTELEVTRTELGVTRTELEVTRTEQSSTQIQLESTRNQLDSTQTELDSTQTELISIQTKLSSTQTELISTQTKLESTQTQTQTLTPTQTQTKPNSNTTLTHPEPWINILSNSLHLALSKSAQSSTHFNQAYQFQNAILRARINELESHLFEIQDQSQQSNESIDQLNQNLSIAKLAHHQLLIQLETILTLLELNQIQSNYKPSTYHTSPSTMKQLFLLQRQVYTLTLKLSQLEGNNQLLNRQISSLQIDLSDKHDHFISQLQKICTQLSKAQYQIQQSEQSRLNLVVFVAKIKDQFSRQVHIPFIRDFLQNWSDLIEKHTLDTISPSHLPFSFDIL